LPGLPGLVLRAAGGARLLRVTGGDSSRLAEVLGTDGMAEQWELNMASPKIHENPL